MVWNQWKKQSLTDVYVWYIRTILLIRSRRTCQSWKIYIICFANRKRAESQRLATALEIYVNGSLKVFNHRTNVELNNRLVCFDIKDLGKQLKKLRHVDCSGSGLEQGNSQPFCP